MLSISSRFTALLTICILGAFSAQAHEAKPVAFTALADLNAPCVEASFIEAMNSQFDISLREKVSADLCDTKNSSLKLYRSLRVLSHVQLSKEPLNNRYNRNLLNEGFFSFLTERIKKITEVDAETVNCKNGSMAFVNTTNAEDGMFICPSFFESFYSIYYAASVILHEARHVEGHEHSLCLLGSKMGSPGGCDESIEENGAYAVSTEALAKMALRATNISAADKKDLKLALLDSLDSFNESLDGVRNTAIYLVSANQKRAFFFDGKQLYPAPLHKDADLLSRNISLIKIPRNGQDAIGLDPLTSRLHAIPAEGACALAYNKTPLTERSRLVDIINDLHASACIFENKIVGTVSTMPEGQADHIVNLPFKVKSAFAGDEIGPDYLDSFFILSTEDKFYRVILKDDGGSEILLAKDKRQSFKKLFYFSSDLTGLQEDGRLMTLDFETEAWSLFPGLEYLRFHSVSRPFLWSHDLVTRERQ